MPYHSPTIWYLVILGCHDIRQVSKPFGAQICYQSSLDRNLIWRGAYCPTTTDKCSPGSPHPLPAKLLLIRLKAEYTWECSPNVSVSLFCQCIFPLIAESKQDDDQRHVWKRCATRCQDVRANQKGSSLLQQRKSTGNKQGTCPRTEPLAHCIFYAGHIGPLHPDTITSYSYLCCKLQVGSGVRTC